MRLRVKAFTNVLRQDAAYFDNKLHSTGKLCTRLASDAPAIKGVSMIGSPELRRCFMNAFLGGRYATEHSFDFVHVHASRYRHRIHLRMETDIANAFDIASVCAGSLREHEIEAWRR